jgi:hypothetical protein
MEAPGVGQVGMPRSAPCEAPAPPQLELSGRQRELLAMLADLKGRVGRLYEGALRVVADGGNSSTPLFDEHHGVDPLERVLADGAIRVARVRTEYRT